MRLQICTPQNAGKGYSIMPMSLKVFEKGTFAESLEAFYIDTTQNIKINAVIVQNRDT